MMSFTKEGFLQAFQFLNKGMNTKEANNYLLGLEASNQCWNIALQLLNQSQQAIQLYGATLVNKKITQVTNTQSSQLLQFLINKISHSSSNSIVMNQLCGAISKLLVNNNQLMSQFTQSTTEQGNQDMKLRILKEIPASICYHTKSILENRELTPNLFKSIIPLLIRCQSQSDLVIEIIQNYSQFCRVDILYSEQLLNRILSLPISKTLRLLNDYFGYCDRNESQITSKLGPYILSFVNEYEMKLNRSYVSLYIELCRCLILRPISIDDFKLLLYNMLQLISNSKDLIIDSGQFWMEVTQSYLEQKSMDEKLILCQTLEILNKTVLEYSILKKLIIRNALKIIQIEDDETTDLGLELGEVVTNCDNIETDVLVFRQTAQDIFRMAYRIIRLFPEKLNSYFVQLHQILIKGQLELELVLFNLKSIVDQIETSQQQHYFSSLVTLLVDHFQSLPKQILIPFTQLLYDSDFIFNNNTQLTEKCLNIFLKMLSVEQVSRLLSQTIQNIVETVCKNGSNTKQLLQKFVSNIFERITSINDHIVRDSIMGALLTLIIHQSNPVESYKNLLSMVINKIEGLQLQKQFELIHSAIYVHNLKINDSNLNQIFAQFVQSISTNIMKIYQQSSSKNKTRLLYILCKCAKQTAQYSPENWAKLAQYFIQNSLRTNTDINYTILLLSSIVENYKINPNLYMQFLSQTLPMIGSIPIKQQTPEITTSFTILYQELANIEYPLNYSQVFQWTKTILKLPFCYSIYKQILKYFIILIKKRVLVQDITIQVLKSYYKISDIFHQQLMTIFIQSYKANGEFDFKKYLDASQISYTHDQYESLIRGLKNQDSKQIKNALLELKS